MRGVVKGGYMFETRLKMFTNNAKYVKGFGIYVCIYVYRWGME